MTLTLEKVIKRQRKDLHVKKKEKKKKEEIDAKQVYFPCNILKTDNNIKILKRRLMMMS